MSETRHDVPQLGDVPEAPGLPCKMWINAFSLVRPTDEFLLGLGRDVAALLLASMQRERTDPLEPIGLITLRMVAS